MKSLLLICFLLISQSNLKLAEKSPYDYSTYSSVSKNKDLTNDSITSSNSDESAVYITETISITNSQITKESGKASKREDSEFYGVNAAVLVQGGKLTMTGGNIITKSEMANALVATNNGEVTITKTNITSTGTSAARGLHSTYGGKITASEVHITTNGGSCASLATDRGEGSVSCENCVLNTNGAGSPLIYSTGNIEVKRSEGTASKAQAVVVEGKNTAKVTEVSSLKCTAAPNRGNIDQCGVMVYQSMSGDASTGTGNFECSDSYIEILEKSEYYKTAPMFFITNTNANIILSNCDFRFGSEKFLSLKGTSEWGRQGSNGGDATLTLTNEIIYGDFEVDGISTLTIKMVKSSIHGKINNANTAKQITIIIDKDSKITLTGNSYCTSITNEDKTGANLVNGTFVWTIGGNSGNKSEIFKLNWLLLSLCLVLSMLF